MDILWYKDFESYNELSLFQLWNQTDGNIHFGRKNILSCLDSLCDSMCFEGSKMLSEFL